MAANTNFLGSGLTQQFTGSDASFAGQVFTAGVLQVGGALNSASAISGAGITGTTGRFTSTLSADGQTRLSTISTGNLSAVGTAEVTSTLSVRGATTLFSTLGSASAVSTGNARVLNLGIGNSSTSIIFASGSSTTIVATTVAATSSTTTSLSDNNVQLGDIILVGPSDLSKGVQLQAYASAASTIVFSYSNASTDAASQVAINCRYVILRSNG